MSDPKPSEVDPGSNIIISVDAMGGDSGPGAVIAGLSIALTSYPNIKYLVHGQKNLLQNLIQQENLGQVCTIIDADKVVSMNDKPSQVMRSGKGTSMWSAISSVKQEKADACVSCGNTGALLAVSMVRLRMIPGINRPAISILWPSLGSNGFNVMLDVGADIRADENDLLQFALMGSSYSRNGFGIKNPKVGLLNVGTEEHKGRPELKLAYDLISAAADYGGFEFIGFVEGNDIPSSRVDVIVTDGFTGNIALKCAEGTASFIGSALKNAFRYNILSRIVALVANAPLRRLKKTTDPRRVNGGVFLGLNGTVVKSHGAADPTAVAAAVSLAYRLAAAKFNSRLAARVASSNSFIDKKSG
jgi:glycerol-3-phosphate acyltransferase PlsX